MRYARDKKKKMDGLIKSEFDVSQKVQVRMAKVKMSEETVKISDSL